MPCVRVSLPYCVYALLIAAPLGCDGNAVTPPGINVPPGGGGTGNDTGADSLDGPLITAGDVPGDGVDSTSDDRPGDSGSDMGDTDTAAATTAPATDSGGTTSIGTTGGGDTTTGAGDTGTGAAGDCCEANGTPSCDDQGCATAVCAGDPFCCDTQWDSACVDVAAGTAACQCMGGGEAGGADDDCCQPHTTTGCNVAACETVVCGDDPFCCDDQWDDVCTDAAFLEASCGCEAAETGGGTGGDPLDGDLVINEVLYDTTGVDTNVFIELAGVPGTGLTGVTIEAINGNGGAVYDSLALSGTIPADGLYLIVGPAANAMLQGLADDVDGIADLQNGPDSVRILVNGTQVDALGYGTFGVTETFAGEGDPAVDVSGDMSLSRVGDTDDNAVDFEEATATPGAAN